LHEKVCELLDLRADLASPRPVGDACQVEECGRGRVHDGVIALSSHWCPSSHVVTVVEAPVGSIEQMPGDKGMTALNGVKNLVLLRLRYRGVITYGLIVCDESGQAVGLLVDGNRLVLPALG